MTYYEASGAACKHCGRLPEEHRQYRDEKPPHCPDEPIVLPEILARNIIRDAERMGEVDRQRFIDEAATRMFVALLGNADDPDEHEEGYSSLAYNAAEALWTERQKRIDEQHARERK
jgi:hypothetical protein